MKQLMFTNGTNVHSSVLITHAYHAMVHVDGDTGMALYHTWHMRINAYNMSFSVSLPWSNLTTSAAVIGSSCRKRKTQQQKHFCFLPVWYGRIVNTSNYDKLVLS